MTTKGHKETMTLQYKAVGRKQIMKNPKLIYMLTIVVVIFGSGLLSPVWSKSRINTTWGGVAIKGYDPVAYFTQGKPVKGSDEFEFEWMDAKWRFSNARHLELFKSDPEKYAPQYGGYWAYAVAVGTTANVDPVNGWKIVDGKLYLNLNRKIQKRWEKDIPGYIQKADQNWPGVLN